jgi:nucleoside-diphosphate-sugar epimerase
MHVLDTGARGRPGVYVVRELAAAGHVVVGVDRLPPPEPPPGEFFQADLTDAGQVYDLCAQVKPEWVCHLAANPSPGGFPRQQTFQNNVISTYHVMQAAGDNGVERLVYAGSEMATGWLTTEQLPPRFPFDENDRVDSPNAYALSKYLGEIIADAMVVRYPFLAIVTLRINNIILPDRYAVLQYSRDHFPEGSANFWSYIDVRDVASACRAALEGSSRGHEVCLIAAADHCLDEPLRDAIARRYGEGARFAPGFGDHQSAFDCSKMARLFGWRAQHSWRNQPLTPD